MPPLSLAAWGDLPEDEPGELVDGHLLEEEMPSFLHEAIVAWLMTHLWQWLVAKGGWVVGSEAKYAVGADRGRKPDVSAYLPGVKRPRPHDSLVRTPPSLMIEVISARPRDAQRDRFEKPADYAAFGVPWYWLVDPMRQTIEIFRLGEGRRYTLVLEASRGVIDVPGCEGLSLDLDALWSYAGNLDEPEDEGREITPCSGPGSNPPPSGLTP